MVGGTGFIGRNLSRIARSRGFEVSVLSSRKTVADKVEGGIRYLQADIGDRGNLSSALSGCRFEYIVNLGGAINHSSYFSGGAAVINTHFNGLINLVNLLDWSGIRGFVQVGSSDEYGSIQSPQSEGKREAPFTSYSFAKTAGGHFLQMLYRENGLPVSIVRFFLVYGPGQDRNRFIPQIIKGCLSGRPFPVSKGEQLRDFCYVDDIAEGILNTLEAKDAKGRVLNLASGKPVSIRSMVEMVRKKVGTGDPLYGQIPYREGENMNLVADISLAEKVLNWRPKVTLEAGIEKTIEYFRRKN